MRKRKTWLISDTHFFHTKIMEYENRPFTSIEEMNQTMIDRWNSVVEKHDLVYHLGDVALSAPFENVLELLNKLNGEIILIAGNHDKQWLNKYRECGRFKFVTGNKHALIVDDWFILSHHPKYLEQNSPYVNIYGHVHGDTKFSTISPSGACVCVERYNYTPVDFEWLKKQISKART